MATVDAPRLREAVRDFWSIRSGQARRQGHQTGVRDTGARAAVTGGAQMNGFVDLLRELLRKIGLPEDALHTNSKLELPGWFRAEKKWDLLVIHESRLIAAMELKSQVGPSFGNNFNNRSEEAIGSATDLWAAFREGAFQPSAKPWLGYLMLLEDAGGSSRPVAVSEPHYHVFPDFREASYTRRYELLLTKLVRERLYDSACLLLSSAKSGPNGDYREPNEELRFARLVELLTARVRSALET